jgi:hypothetical protein
MLEERIRSSLYEQLKSRYWTEEATAVVEAVAEVHGGRLATKDDIADLKDEFHSAVRALLMWLIPTMATFITIAVLVASRIG